ncbi:MAG: hypothetical protein J4215_05350 [Candidatus Diapherotrites archaeon]|uniref:Uncharacterized protein n=1 Tax=Candidatus Iainarchaeum sp. TaxID=3101447 RepID=A0A8T4LB99_9ARCH|nr:hypothetical protein [Candidatus Diapherotrites archaeon]
MGIYDSLPQLDLDMDSAKKYAAIVAAIVVVGCLAFVLFTQNNTAFSIFSFLNGNPIDAKFDGPINLSIGSDGLPVKTSTNLVVTLTNPSNQPARDVSILVRASDDQALIIYPSSRVIPVLDKTRNAQFTIRPNPVQPALSGTYLIEIQAFVGDKEYSKQIELQVKTNEP